MCNALVCLAVWMCYGARTTIDRVVTIVPPITAFAAAGFEHCVANMYFIPMGLFIKAGAPDSFWQVDRQDAGGLSGFDLGEFLRCQSAAGDDRQHHRRLGHGRRRLLVRLPAQRSRHEANRRTTAGFSQRRSAVCRRGHLRLVSSEYGAWLDAWLGRLSGCTPAATLRSSSKASQRQWRATGHANRSPVVLTAVGLICLNCAGTCVRE